MVGSAVWLGAAEHSEDLTQGPGSSCRGVLERAEPGPGSDYQLFLREERGPRNTAAGFLCWGRR